MAPRFVSVILLLWLAAFAEEGDGARLASHLSDAVHVLHNLPHILQQRDRTSRDPSIKISSKTAAAEKDRVTSLPGLDSLDSALYSG